MVYFTYVLPQTGPLALLFVRPLYLRVFYTADELIPFLD